MTRRIIDERDALRRTVARQDAQIKGLEEENRRLRSAHRSEQIKAEGVREYLEDFAQKAQVILKEYL